VTIFAGNLERFFMLAAARRLRCPVIYIQDPISFWYQGSTLLPDLDALCRRVLIPEIGPARALLFGQSSGAYAALAASVRLPGASVIACAPQTFSDAHAKGRITFMGIRALSAPEGLIDLRAHLAAHPDPDAMRAVVIAAGELDNPAHLHWWGDYLHMLRLTDVAGTDCYVVNANTHVLVHGRINDFAGLLADLVAESSSPSARRAEVLRALLTAIYAPA
jgi:pimeloyl-ACP methyl ester carboxylesterase